MAAELVMPQLGLTMTEGKVLKWYKQPGESFATGEPLFEVETDKVNMDVEATEPGSLLEIVAPLNEVLSVRTVVARYARGGEPAEPQKPSRIFASPRARKLAAERGVDLAQLHGSGPGGRIVEQDVAQAATAVPVPEVRAPEAFAAVAAPPAPAGESRLRRTIAERMTQSFQSAPHFYLTREVDATDLLHLQRILAAGAEKRGRIPIGITDLLLKAMADAFVEHPAVNATWQEGGVRRRGTIDVGLAVAHEDGLIVPVLHGLDKLSLRELAERRAALIERVRGGKLKPEDLGEASATLSNLGMYGVDQFQAILNPPESVILATGRIRERVVALNGAPVVRSTLHVTLSVDHRVLDGAQAAKFLATIAVLLENPGALET